MNEGAITWAILFAAVMQGIAIGGCYWGLKADNDRLAAKLEQAMLQERLDRTAQSTTLREYVLGLIATVDAAVKELSRRVNTLDAGQDEWTKALRQRTHDLAEQLNVVAMKVDRLERPGKAGNE